MFGCANNSELFNLIANQYHVSSGISAEQAADSHAADTGTEPVGDWASTWAYIATVNKAAKDLAGEKAAVASEIVPPCGADQHEKSNSDSGFESCHGSDHEEFNSDSLLPIPTPPSSTSSLPVRCCVPPDSGLFCTCMSPVVCALIPWPVHYHVSECGFSGFT